MNGDVPKEKLVEMVEQLRGRAPDEMVDRLEEALEANNEAEMRNAWVATRSYLLKQILAEVGLRGRDANGGDQQRFPTR